MLVNSTKVKVNNFQTTIVSARPKFNERMYFLRIPENKQKLDRVFEVPASKCIVKPETDQEWDNFYVSTPQFGTRVDVNLKDISRVLETGLEYLVTMATS